MARRQHEYLRNRSGVANNTMGYYYKSPIIPPMQLGTIGRDFAYEHIPPIHTPTPPNQG